MFDEVIVCLDGSSLAEKILPLARGIATAKGGKLTLLRVVEDVGELAAEEDYLRDCARQYAAQLSLLVGADAGAAIAAHLQSVPALPALTTAHRLGGDPGISRSSDPRANDRRSCPSKSRRQRRSITS
jgi:nucleotide-binding universal stress UspA family protein